MSPESIHHVAPLPEVELALLLSSPVLDTSEVARARHLVSQLLDWNQVFGLLVMHRTISVAWQNIVDNGLGDPRDFKPEYVLPVIEAFARGQDLLAEDHLRYASRLVREFEGVGIRSAVLKGEAMAAMGYRRLGMRISNDTDILIRRTDLAAAGQLMADLGYVQGSWDLARRVVVPATRNEIVKHTVYSHETFPYVKPVTDARMMDRHTVDVHFSVELNTTVDSDAAVSDLLDRRIRIEPAPQMPLWTLRPEDMFVFACVHFTREAQLRTETVELVDLVLYKLIDLLALLANDTYPITVTELLGRTRELGMARDVYFALHHLTELFPGKVSARLIEELKPDSIDYIDEVQDFATPPHKCQATFRRWKSPIIERFFNTRRLLEITEESEVS